MKMKWVLRAPGASPPFSAPARLKVGFGTGAGNVASILLFETPLVVAPQPGAA